MTAGRCALVLFARVPRAGEVKTRLTPWLNPAEALRLHLALLEDGAALLRRAGRLARAAPWIAFSEPWEPPPRGACALLRRRLSGVARLPQVGGDLGERMQNTFRDLLGRGHQGVVIFGSDSPTLTAGRLRDACDALRGGAEVVLGPAMDGGYYLIGLRRMVPGLFGAIPWGTSGVIEATRRAIARRRARAVQLPIGYDVDRPEDLARLRADLAAPGAPPAPRTAAFVEALACGGRLPDAVGD
jgi:rSAM/selenodomain-associated transferase 1